MVRRGICQCCETLKPSNVSWSTWKLRIMQKEVEFEISRTSEWPGYGEPPYEGAYPKQVTNRRGVLVERWFIEISSLEELIGLAKNTGHEIVLSEGSLEIYDDYRE